jgi:hypothetical protein
MPDETRVLFCPFCRECFEGQARCPEHDLALVTFDALPRTLEDAASEIPREDEDVSSFDGRFGRGFVAAGAVAFLISFAMKFVDIAVQGDRTGFSGFEAASGRAPNLWTVPFVGALLIAILARRRSLNKMRGARLSVMLLGFAPLFAIGYSYFRVLEGAAEAARAGGANMDVTPGLGVFVAALGSFVVAYGARRLGHVDLRGLGPARADLDTRSPIDGKNEPP